MRLYTFLALTLIIIAVTEANAQPFYFRHYQVEDCLSYNSVLCSLQDRAGFMWFGTRDGLNRFDGYRFKAFKFRRGEKNGLGNNYVYSLAQDSLGRLWVGTTGGLFGFDPLTEKFRLVPQTASKTISEIVVDALGKTWFLCGGRLASISRAGSFQSYGIGENKSLLSIALGNNKEILLASETGLVIRFNQTNGSFRYYSVFPKSSGASARRIEKIWMGPDSQLFVGTSDQGVKVVDLERDSYRDILTVDQDNTEILARSFCQMDAGMVWIGTESGIYIYDSKDGKLQNLKKNFYDPYSLSDNAIYTICRDREGGIWVGTYFGGINYYSVANTRFEKYLPKLTEKSLTGNLVREFCQDKNGYLWIGTEDAGLNRLDLSNNTFLHVGFSGSAGSIAYNNIHGLLSVGNELWIGTYQHGLDVMDIRTNQVVRHYGYGIGPNDLKSNFVNVIFRDREGIIYLGTQVGLYRYNARSDNFTFLAEAGTGYISSLMQDHLGRLWVGTFGNGAFLRSAGKQSWRHFEAGTYGRGKLPSNVVTDIFQDSRRRIWLCTENGGLSEFLVNKTAFQPYELPAGLGDKYLFNMIEDEQKRLWITSSGGLICLNPSNGRLRLFTKNDGLLNDQFNYRSAFRDSRGSLYFGSSKGFIRYNTPDSPASEHPVPLYITGIQTDSPDKKISVKDGGDSIRPPFAERITLGPGNTSFNIDFAALSYIAPGTTSYSYKLEGLDKSWITLPANRRVYYTQVPPGDYNFMVRADVGEAGPSTTTRSLSIIIRPPFYAGTVAIVFYWLFAGIMLYTVYGLIQKRLRRQNLDRQNFLDAQKEREIYQSKIDFFTHITHEIRTPLTLIKAPLEKVLQESDGTSFRNDLLLVNRNTDRLLDLVDQLLSFRQTEINGYRLNFNRTDVSSMLSGLGALFTEPARQAGISLKLDLPGSPLIAYVDKDAFEKIISNLLSNAVKYAQTLVTLELSAENQSEFMVIVRNDGHLLAEDTAEKIFLPFIRSAIHRDKPGTGIGLPLARALADLHGGSLRYLIGDSQLNTFKLMLPTHQLMEMNIGENGEASRQEEAYSSAERPVDRPSILVVEDHQELRDFVSGLLSGDYAVLSASHAAQAIELLSRNSVHLIVSDVMMPGIDGFELCRRLKADIHYSHIPFIILTARNTMTSKMQGLDCGSDAFIEKPFSPDYLTLQIANLLKSRSYLKAHYANSPMAPIESMAHSTADDAFIQKLNAFIVLNISRPEFDIEQLAEHMNMSRATLYRKVKGITDLSPAELVTLTRLKKAAELLSSGGHKVYEIADLVGFTSSAVLGRAFQKQFGMSPSVYATGKAS